MFYNLKGKLYELEKNLYGHKQFHSAAVIKSNVNGQNAAVLSFYFMMFEEVNFKTLVLNI